MLGANIGGIPGQDNPNAFFEVLGLVLLVVGVQYLILKRMRWL